MSNRRSITKAKHRRPSAAARHGQRAVVVTVAGGMAAGGFVAAAGSAVADHTIVSQAGGYFLSGNVASLQLKGILPTAEAVNKSHDKSSIVLGAENGQLTGTSGLADVPLGVAGVNLLGSGGILDVSALAQYARANGDGSSHGASGAVTSAGAIASGAPVQNASVNLDNVLGSLGGLNLADLSLDIGALAATATQTAGGVQTGDYKIADLVLNLQSPALGTVLTTLSGALGTANGLLPEQLNTQADGALLPGPLPGGAPIPVGDVDLTNLPNLAAALTTFNSTLLDGSDGISIDPSNGRILIDLDTLIPNLNNLPPNTPLLPFILAGLDGLVVDALGDLTDDIAAEFNRNIGVALTALPGVPLVGPALDAVLATLTAALTSAEGSALGLVTGATGDQNNLLDADDGLIGGVLDGILDLVANVQVLAGGTFTERALAIGISAGGTRNVTDSVADGGLAVVNLASAAVGPNLAAAVVALAPPVITDPEDGDTTTDRTPLIEGTGVPGATVTVKKGSNTICTAKVAANGTWKCTSERLALGKHTIVATQKLGDRTSGKSNVVDFRILAADYDDDNSTALPRTGGNGSTPLVAAAGLGLLLGGMGLTALPGARHGGATSNGGSNRARGGRHAKR